MSENTTEHIDYRTPPAAGHVYENDLCVIGVDAIVV
jgi:hypothetical protein